MKFTIRDLLLITFIVAVSLGWLVDHWRAAARDAKWKVCFYRALDALSSSDRQQRELDTPDGPITVYRKPEPNK